MSAIINNFCDERNILLIAMSGIVNNFCTLADPKRSAIGCAIGCKQSS